VADDLLRYRAYTLESTVVEVVAISGARDLDVKSLDERPAQVQQLEWHHPYLLWGTEEADPIQDIIFRFYNRALYHILVTYDRGRMEGMTNEDVIASLSETYDSPPLRRAGARGVAAAAMAADTTVVARWEDRRSSPSLVGATHRNANCAELEGLEWIRPQRHQRGGPFGWKGSAIARAGPARKADGRRLRPE
jgi:hypothetical protein